MVAVAISRGYLNYLADPHPASLKVFEGLLSLSLLPFSLWVEQQWSFLTFALTD